MPTRTKKRADALAAEIPFAPGFICDIAAEVSVKACFAAIREEMGEIDTLLYCAGSGVFADVEPMTEQFEASRAGERAPPSVLPRGDPADEGSSRGQHRSNRRQRVTPGRQGNRRLCVLGGGSARPGGIDGALALVAGIHVALIVVEGG